MPARIGAGGGRFKVGEERDGSLGGGITLTVLGGLAAAIGLALSISEPAQNADESTYEYEERKKTQRTVGLPLGISGAVVTVMGIVFIAGATKKTTLAPVSVSPSISTRGVARESTLNLTWKF